ncbi:hypothetical protein PF008_g6451 [Phytophthora fragariae]|uniref:Sugar phosphate phosphatase n=1 Tax=Phytophthora fragariae TaxID=53985 RepID=A0A6G0S605_9STRA|nr:hypothetical protein PF008_g6451 [Phytophthora fragariae]
MMRQLLDEVSPGSRAFTFASRSWDALCSSPTSSYLAMGVSNKFIERIQQQDGLVANEPDTFAHSTCTVRMPQVLRDCVAKNGERFSADERKRLLQLADDMANDAEIQLPSAFPEQAAKSPTSKHWESLLAGKGYTWQNSPWFMCEQYMFHLVLLMTGYYSTGFDPFHYSKVAELKGDTPWSLLQTAVETSSQSRHDQLKRLMMLCLWGNKADGTNAKVMSTMHVFGDSLVFDDYLVLVDYSDRVISFLEQKAREGGDAKALGVEFISDNIGTELLLDLAMADHMLTHNWCGKVTFNVKAEPLYVSDVMLADVHEHIEEMQRSTRTPEVQALGKRLAEYLSKGQIVVRSDTYWNEYTYFWKMPTELQSRLDREATLVILKGDLNYRRLLSDRLWPPSTPVEEVVPYFPAAFVAFRILKSIPVMGIPANIVDKLDKDDPNWRLNGEHGTIQSVLSSPLQ